MGFFDTVIGRVFALAFVVLVGYAAWQTIAAHRAETRVAELTQELKGVRKAMEVIERVAEEREESRVITTEVVTHIMESPNAEVLVPSDIALSWAAGIDRLRDEAIRSGESDSTVRATPTSEREWSDGGEAGSVLGAAGRSS